ncbi:hypothetical protein [Mycobacterium uberis]|nr:hypothetical protein [Mycobacterium uberis]
MSASKAWETDVDEKQWQVTLLVRLRTQGYQPEYGLLIAAGRVHRGGA